MSQVFYWLSGWSGHSAFEMEPILIGESETSAAEMWRKKKIEETECWDVSLSKLWIDQYTHFEMNALHLQTVSLHIVHVTLSFIQEIHGHNSLCQANANRALC